MASTAKWFVISLVSGFISLLVSSCGVGPSQMAAPRLIVMPGEESHVTNKDLEAVPGHQAPKTSKPMDEHQLRDTIIAFGIRDFGQINETMAVLTGIDPMTRVSVQGGNRTIQSFYLELSTQLPESNDAKTFLAANQVGISKLAVEYCDALVTDQQVRSQVAPGFNFAQTPSAAFNDNAKRTLAEGFINRFWGSDLSTLPDRQATINELASLMDNLVLNGSTNNAQATLNIAKGVCTAVLASAPVMFL